MVSATYFDVSLVAIKKMSTKICQWYIIPPPNKKLLDKMKNVKGKERTLVQSDVEMLRHLVSLLSR